VAEEIVQDLFLTIWRKRATLVIETSVTTYLFTAARNRAMNHLRRERVVRRWEILRLLLRAADSGVVSR
jgi:RNA polymerase sigma-70 factor (ECF subfamily)